MSESDPKTPINPDVKPNTEKEEPGEKDLSQLSEEELDKLSGGLVPGVPYVPDPLRRAAIGGIRVA